MLLSSIKSIWLYPMIVDFRKQLDGLIVLIVDAQDIDPSSGDLFIFRNRPGNELVLSQRNLTINSKAS